jgi:hypothetical protein
MKPIIGSALRTLAVGAAAAGVVVGAGQVNGRLDLSDPARAVGTATTAAVTSVESICSGQELVGIPGVRNIVVGESAAAAAAPQDLLSGLSVGAGGSIQLPTGRQPVASVTARGRTVTSPVPGGGLIRSSATGSLAPGLAASQEWSSATKDLRGLASAPCGTPAPESWLIGGGSAPGRQERIVLVNPGANEVTADLTVLGATGIVSRAGGASVTVPARGRAMLLLDALAPSEPAPVVHVAATGGSLWASLLDTWLDGSVPAGIETATPVAAPSTRLVIPEVDLGAPATLRIAAPGTQEAVVTARVLGPTGASPLPGTSVVRVAARSVKELPLKGLPVGTYAVELRSDEDVVASVVTTARAGSGPGDFAWSGATDPIEGVAGVPFPNAGQGQSPVRVLALAASGGAVQVTVVSVDAAGKASAKSLNLPADSATTLPFEDLSSLWVRRDGGAGELRAAVRSTIGRGDSRLISSMPLRDTVLTSTVSRAYPLP